MQDIEKSIINRIRGNGRGWCFTPKDFANLGGTSAVWTSLHRLAKRGYIRRLSKGLYDFPRTHPELGILSPDPDTVTKALSRGASIRIQPTGAYAANLLGLSEQVPARVVFLTDGAPRRIRIGKSEIILRRTTPRNMVTAGRISGIAIQALRFIGKEHITSAQRSMLMNRLSASEKRQLCADLLYAPGWMRSFLKEICVQEKPDV
jgi:hypothetical protein